MAITLINTIVTVKDGFRVKSDGTLTTEREFPTGRFHFVAQFANSGDTEVAEFRGATVGQSSLYSMTLSFTFTEESSDSDYF